MKVAVFSAKPYDKKYLAAAAPSQFELTYHSVALTPKTAALLSDGEADALCAFVNDQLPAEVLDSLHAKGVRAILLRCAGFNNVDIDRAEKLGLFVAHVPAYSPEAVAEFAVALIQTINRKTHRAYMRVREGNFALDGLLGRTLHGKTVGLIGTGRIGIAFARIMKGYGCRLLAYDPYPSKAFEEYGEYTTLEDLIPQSDIISLHCPLTEQTRHIISSDTLALLRPGAIMVNTSRGGLIDTRAAIEALKSRKLGGLALDVYEGEGALFYDDHSGDIIQDDELMRLMTFPNVVVCGHQAFFTEEALTEIAECTMRNLEHFVAGRDCKHALVKARYADAPKPAAEEEEAAAAAAEEGDATVSDRRPVARRDSLPVRTV